MGDDLEPRPGSASRIHLVRRMTLLDTNSHGNVHGGVIMREIDEAAGTAASRHAGGPVVTASVDELSFLGPVEVGDLLHVMARVNAVGRTSLEVGVRVEAEPSGGGEHRHTTSAYLVFVALDEVGGGVTRVPPLLVTDESGERRQAQAQIRREVRKERIERLGSWRPEAPQQP